MDKKLGLAGRGLSCVWEVHKRWVRMGITYGTGETLMKGGQCRTAAAGGTMIKGGTEQNCRHRRES